MKIHTPACLPLLAAFLLLPCMTAAAAPASDQPGSSPSASSGGNTLEYKMVSGFKQPFNDDLKYQTSKGWTPVGGVSVTAWNNDLYFAQLLSRPAGSGQ
jgi:hypothetical protein